MRLIDADALHNRFLKRAWYDNADRDECACVDVDNAPTVDAVEVVRCKDCKYSKTPKTAPYMLSKPNVLKCGCSGAACTGRLVYPTDFCSYGERKDDGL